MADISQSNWSETDSSNNTAAPDGAPENMPASGVNNTMRAMAGAIKRLWNRINGVYTTGGGTTAYTLTPTVAYGAYTKERWTVLINATNTGAVTLNISALGAKNVYKQTAAGPAALAAGDWVTGMMVDLVYDGTQFQMVSPVAASDAGSILTTRGDIIYRSASAVARLALGAAKTYPRSDGTDIAYSAIQSVDLPSGAVVQVIAATPYVANADLTTTIPVDDTIPQNTEGTQILTLTITPKSATNKVRLRFRGAGAVGSGSATIAVAMFANSTASAIAANGLSTTAAFVRDIGMDHIITPGSTSAHTYTVRVGPDSTGALRMNGSNTARYFGGAMECTLVATEYVA